jgi:hypothetical protein
MGEKAKFLEMLKRVGELGDSNWDWIARDTDLNCLHGDPEFEHSIEEGRAKG